MKLSLSLCNIIVSVRPSDVRVYFHIDRGSEIRSQVVTWEETHVNTKGEQALGHTGFAFVF